MAIFDEYIEQCRKYFDTINKNGALLREYESAESAEQIKEKLPVRVGKKANRGIILRSETFMELGNPLQGSCSVFLWTDDTSKIRNGKITLLGPDIQETEGEGLPLGQIFLVGGKKLPELEHNNLTHNHRVSNDIEGFMLRSSPSHDSWGRVSKDAAGKGFSFEILGKAMIALYKTRIPEAESVEIIFITTSKEDVQGLGTIASKAREISREIVKEAWKAKGYDLDCDYDCSSCGDSNVCDPIREAVKKRADRLERKYVTQKSIEGEV